MLLQENTALREGAHASEKALRLEAKDALESKKKISHREEKLEEEVLTLSRRQLKRIMIVYIGTIYEP